MRIDIDPALIETARLAELAYQKAKNAVNEAVLAASPFAKNDIVRDKDTGARYRITGGSGYLSGGRARLLLSGHRVYITGRREAMSCTHLSIHNLEKVES